jgi:signal transduction histidine kinase
MTDQRKRETLRKTELIQLNKDLQKQIADLRVMENRLQATNELLNLFLRKSSRHEYLEAVVNLLYQWSECRGIGIRLIDSQGNIPYEAYRGFSSAFWKSENCLSLHSNQCLCSRIIQGKPLGEETSFLTKAGSFCSNDLSSFMARISADSQNKYRGVCVRSGFNSLAIIPVRHQQKVLGAIHLADERQGCISPALLEFIETMAPLIGETIHRFNLEDELKNSEQRLRVLSAQLLTAQENERKRIARELHDSIGQSLAAIKFVLEKKISQLNSAANFPGSKLEDIVPMIQDTMEEIRRVSMDLWPSILDDLGLLSGINYFCRQFGEIYSTIKIDKDLSVAEDAIPSSLKIVIYRILQEALNNIAKYSKADKVLISLHKKNNHLELMIADNGIGFDYQSFPKGMGLLGMKERVELSGGDFTLTSLPHQGTSIKARWLIS